MKLFIKRCFLFAIPFIVYFMTAIYIDPYDIIHSENHKVLAKLESSISYKLNYPLYKLQQYISDPTDAILLGDSRADKLDNEILNKFSNSKITNLAYGGGTLPEIIETFWYISKIQRLKEAYIGINFNLFNFYNDRNRVDEAIRLIDSWTSYLTSSYCFKATYLIIKSIILGNHDINIEKPDMSESQFWEYQLNVSAKSYYQNYKYPKNDFEELIKISNYCKKEKIKLVFFIPPTHIDLQKKISDFNLKEEEKKFKNDLSRLAPVYDFDYSNPMNQDKTNFLDPFHFNKNIALKLAEEIVTGKLELGILIQNF